MLTDSSTNSQTSLHKTLLLSLCYLHAVLSSRNNFGAYGWNHQYVFDQHDFDISEKTITKYISDHSYMDSDALIGTLGYVLGRIFYAGKVST